MIGPTMKRNPIKSTSSLIAAAFLMALLPMAPRQVLADSTQSISSWQKRTDGITFRTRAGGVLELQVWNPDVIRVRFTPANALPTIHSFAVIGSQSATPWHLKAGGHDVSIVTSDIQARVDCATGAVSFLNAVGTTVLGEVPGGRTAQSVAFTGSTQTTYQISQQFALPSGEAIYGLGQHQDGLMDYRGNTVTLLQQNREVGIPFLISNRGYGVLWDTPSVTKVNVGSGDQETIPSAQFFTEDGKPGGLTGRYYEGQNFNTLVATRTDPQIDFNWTAAPPPGLPHDHYSVRWTGFVQAKDAGDYTLAASTDDGVRLWIDDKQAIDDWNSRGVKTNSAVVHFAANSRHSIRLEFFQDTYDSIAQLAWRLPAQVSAVSWSSEAADDIDYYFLYGPSIDRVISSYRGLTGQAPMPPKWALGYWQSKERYKSQQELLDIVGQYRAQHLPLDVIVQDWLYWAPHPWGSHEFDADRYPNPTQMMTDLHAEHAHLMISVWAKFDVGSANANELSAVNGLYPKVIPYVYPPGNGQWYDPFNPAARKIYWAQMSRELFSHGIDGWWLDASEPELSGNWGEFRDFTTAAGPGAKVFNAYPLEHSRAIYEGQRKETDKKRVVILTRSAYAGQQRNGAATWSGDIGGSWNVFANEIPAGLNFCLSGIPYWTTDVGGFFVGYPGGSSNPDYAELFTRWFEYGAFCPIFRVHGTDTSKEMWRFGPTTETTLLKYDDLRYRLMPYIYSQAWQVTHGSSTLMRALVMDFPNDAKACEIKDEFLFGPSMLVCPVTKQGATTRDVYLPAGTTWTDFWTGKTYPGGQTIAAAAPIDTMPLYVRSGAILPMGPYIQYADDHPNGPIELRLYPGANGAFTFYQDDGSTYNYEKGAYATVPIHWDGTRKTLTIGARLGAFTGMPAKISFNIVSVAPGFGVGVEPASTTTNIISYAGRSILIKITNLKP